MRNTKLRGSLYLSVAASIWGGMFVVVKNVVATIPPIELVWLRYLIAIVCLGTYALLKGFNWQMSAKSIRLIVAIGVIGNAISIVTQETGTMLSSAQLGSVITSVTPVFMLVFARLLLKEKLSLGKTTAVLLATLGVVVIVGVHLTGQKIILGIFWLVIAALTWALMSILVKKVPATIDGVQVTLCAIIVAFLILTPFVLTQTEILRQIPYQHFKIWGSLLYLGGISTAFAFVLWNKGLNLLNTGSSGLFFLFQPVVGTLLGCVLLGEGLQLNFLFGALLIVISVWVSIRFS